MTRPTPQSRSTGKRMEERELVVGRNDEQAVGLRDAARDLREELRPRHAHRDAQADLLEHSPPQPRGDLGRRPGEALEAADVEERLVDRHPLDERRRVLEDLEHRLARFRVGRHPGLDHAPRAGTACAPGGRPSPCGCRTPWPRSSRRARPSAPTITGRPRRRGSSRCSTDAKNASRSACRIVVSRDTNICSHRPQKNKVD